MNNLKEAIKKRKSIVDTLAEKEKEKTTLLGRMSKLSEAANRQSMENAEAAKTEAVRLFAIGEIDRDKLDSVISDYEKASKVKRVDTELVKSLDELILSVDNVIKELKKEYEKIDSQVWLLLSEQLIEEIKSNTALQQKVWRAYAARNAGRRFYVNLTSFCEDLFKDYINKQGGSETVMVDIERQYLS